LWKKLEVGDIVLLRDNDQFQRISCAVQLLTQRHVLPGNEKLGRRDKSQSRKASKPLLRSRLEELIIERHLLFSTPTHQKLYESCLDTRMLAIRDRSKWLRQWPLRTFEILSAVQVFYVSGNTMLWVRS